MTPSPSYSPNILPIPPRALNHAPITIYLTGFPENAAVRITWDHGEFIAEGNTNAAGVFSTGYNVQRAQPGTKTIVAKAIDSLGRSVEASASFEVLEPTPPPPTPTPAVASAAVQEDLCTFESEIGRAFTGGDAIDNEIDLLSMQTIFEQMQAELSNIPDLLLSVRTYRPLRRIADQYSEAFDGFMGNYGQYTSTYDYLYQDQAHIWRDTMAGLNLQLTEYQNGHSDVGPTCWPA